MDIFESKKYCKPQNPNQTIIYPSNPIWRCEWFVMTAPPPLPLITGSHVAAEMDLSLLK